MKAMFCEKFTFRLIFNCVDQSISG
uniref:Uncharacterized protein n=1 Tax=Anguilla anguilla TaxID=7936 RepID=A0A0E9X8R2_ANGAN